MDNLAGERPWHEPTMAVSIPSCKAVEVTLSNQILVTRACEKNIFCCALISTKKLNIISFPFSYFSEVTLKCWIKTEDVPLTICKLNRALRSERTGFNLNLSLAVWLCLWYEHPELLFLICKMERMMPICGIRSKIKALYNVLPSHLVKSGGFDMTISPFLLCSGG